MTQSASSSPNAASPAAQARRLIRACDRATLSTALHDQGDWPYGSLVLCAAGHDGCPLLLLSDLAEHSRNASRDPRVSLLFDGTAGRDDPLTGARVSVLGELLRDTAEVSRRRFLARHPTAEVYTDFADFHFYRLAPARAHLVAGFGAIDWIDGTELAYDTAGARALIEAEPDILSHMNQDHAEAIDSYANSLLDRPGDGWTMTGIDAEGVDLRRAGEVARVDFPAPLSDPREARVALVALAAAARDKAARNKLETKP